MLDLENVWFYSDENVKYGGMFEWMYKNKEYKVGDNDYIALFVEEIDPERGYNVSDDIHRIPISLAKQRMKDGVFRETSHPTYYYWNKFVNEVMKDWDIFKNKKSLI